MDISLRDAARRVTEQSGNRQLEQSQIAGDASKSVSTDVRCHTGKFRLGASPIEHSTDTDEMPIPGRDADYPLQRTSAGNT